MHIERKHIIMHIHKCDIIKITHIYPPKHGCKYTCARHSSHEKGYSIVTCCLGNCYSQTGIACVLECVRKCTVCIWPPRGHTNRSSHLSLHLSPYYSLHIPSPSSLYIPPHFSLHFLPQLSFHIFLSHIRLDIWLHFPQRSFPFSPHISLHISQLIFPHNAHFNSHHTPHHTKRSLLRRNPSPSPHHSIAHVSIPSK